MTLVGPAAVTTVWRDGAQQMVRACCWSQRKVRHENGSQENSYERDDEQELPWEPL